jgi:hypothetical protein
VGSDAEHSPTRVADPGFRGNPGELYPERAEYHAWIECLHRLAEKSPAAVPRRAIIMTNPKPIAETAADHRSGP